MLKNLTKFINYLIKIDLPPMLGRWCHKGIPNCNDSVIEKKISFALLDNNLCITNKSNNKSKN